MAFFLFLGEEGSMAHDNWDLIEMSQFNKGLLYIFIISNCEHLTTF